MRGKRKLYLGSYPGGKFGLVPWIYRLFPPHRIYIEPFAGLATVLLNKRPSEAEIINDVSGTVVNLMRVLADPDASRELQRRLEALIISDQLYHQAVECLIEKEGQIAKEPDVDWAFAFLLVKQTGYAGRATTRMTIKPRRLAILIELAATMSKLRKRLARVVFSQRDAISLIRQADNEEAFFFLDPPYLGTYCHQYEQSRGQDYFARLVKVLKTLKGKFLLVSFPHPLYDSQGWYRRQLLRRKAMGDDRKKPLYVETFWANYSLDPMWDEVRFATWSALTNTKKAKRM